MNWNKYPFIRLVAGLAVGILIGDRVGEFALDKTLLIGVLVVLLLVMVVLQHHLKTFRYRWVFGVVALITLVWMGFVRVCVEQRPLAIQKEGWRLARVLEPPEERDKTVKVLLELEEGKVMAYFEKSDEALRLSYGDMIGFSVPLEEVAPPKNPMEFDYQKYLERRGVAWSVYLKSSDWLSTGVRRVNLVYDFAYRFRQRLLQSLRQCGITDDEFGVGAAILLGYDDSLPAQVRQNYVAAGSMHILCVSGMHVGIIYLLASVLLSVLGKGKHMIFVRKVILLLLIWFYALIAGLSPSIVRSALMISFLIFGELIHRKGFALNSIAASAFVILLINPNHLFAMGFQLSFSAVIGILLLQKPIFNLLFFNNKWIDKAWEITAVSLAAQLATMPFTVYYFKQFTPYFWLSNLLLTPLSFIVILTGMLLLAISWAPFVNMLVGKLVWLSIYMMNWVVAGIEHWPFSLVKGLYMTDFQFALSLMLLSLLWLFVNLKRKRMVMELLVVAVVFVFSMAWRSQRLAHQSQVIVYSLRNHTAISVINGFDQMLLCDEGLFEEPSTIDYSLRGYWAARQLLMNPRCHTLSEDFADDLMLKRKQFISVQGLLFAFWDPNMTLANGNQRISVDYMLVRGKQKPDLKGMLKTYRPGMLLIDGSVPGYLAKEWIQQAETLKIPYYDLNEGAFVM